MERLHGAASIGSHFEAGGSKAFQVGKAPLSAVSSRWNRIMCANWHPVWASTDLNQNSKRDHKGSGY